MDETKLPALELVRAALALPDGQAQKHPSAEITAEVACVIHEQTGLADELRDLIFGTTIPLDTAFFHSLMSVGTRLGFSEPATEIAGEIWASAMGKLSADEQQTLLSQLLAAPNLEFFTSLRALPWVVRSFQVPADFLIDWFTELRNRVGNDFAQGGFWRSLESWAQLHPASALAGLRLLASRELNDETVTIGAAILGRLRVAWESGPPNESGLEFEQSLARHGDVQKRLVYHRSWINTGWDRGLSHSEFQSSLTRMATGTHEERAEAFNFLRCLLPDRRMQPESITLGIEWLREHTNSSTSDGAKHWVIHSVQQLASASIADNQFLEGLWPLMVAVQPITSESRGTWNQIEHLLVDLLHKNRPQFEELLRLLVDAHPEGLIQQMASHDQFQFLRSELAAQTATAFCADLLFSNQRHRRQFGFTLYDELPFDAFPDEILDARTDDEIALTLFESQLHYLQPDNTRRFLLSLRQRAESGSPQLAALFRDELLYQAKNLPGAVLDQLKQLNGPSALLKTVVAAADTYFEATRKAHTSSINAMEIPGWRRALSMKARRQSRDIEAHSNELSVFKQMCSNSYLIYGDRGFRYSRDGELGEFSAMQTFSTQMELPRLAMIDPEGVVIRRHNAITMTNRLAAAIRSREAEK